MKYIKNSSKRLAGLVTCGVATIIAIYASIYTLHSGEPADGQIMLYIGSLLTFSGSLLVATNFEKKKDK